MENKATTPAICTTCSSEIIETINGGNFNGGECGRCEYERYCSQSSVLEALRLLDSCVRMGSMGAAYTGSNTEQVVKNALQGWALSEKVDGLLDAD